ncbi:MAG: MraY family glycosyltransferase [Caulobacterales bacterium]
MSILVVALLVLIAALAAAASCNLLIQAGIADAPDYRRKAHKAAVPTSGGLGVAIGASLAIAVAIWLARPYWSEGAAPGSAMGVAAAWVFGFAALGIGLLDDLMDVNAGPKFGWIALLSLLFAMFVVRIDTLALWPGMTLAFGPVLGVLGTALWLFVMANGVNFMDGANGLAMGSMAVGLLALAAYAFWGGAPAPALAALLLAAALVGFLYWNFPNGRLFAGDAGSLFVGFTAGALALVAIREAHLPVLLAPLLFLPLLADVLLTMAWRVKHKRNLLQAHRDHLYQVAIRAGATHKRIAIAYWLAMLHCALAAGVSLAFGDAGALAAFVVTVLLAVYLSFHGRRFAAAHGLDAP